MAREEDEGWRRRREREKENEEIELNKPNVASKAGLAAPTAIGASSNEKLVQLMDQAGPLIEQVNHLYNMFFSGAEKKPPIERRKHLEQVMASIQLTSKPTPSIQFRANNLMSGFQTHRDRWDRMLKELEDGKRSRRG
jgi:hypothetical protein